ncbi:hypothetical protein CONPUDRAFT_159664 [Coniophora puteana RWD-64-598 SS2]|uniref:Uncharacterized protein n=1 Tax=Coniophora puteana (strain RWD-64-598) TaxID=741705 RepID=A0A5M3M7X5_CONPW|nr:uncharacterized protein CONPUDRAFT_159664 [Coniophora puteana RWD-64-598 SS2]EIW74890.1 hypothetical protein CONPUDRAFT_159664 [Coniophora puteana RWD-64-598 SS2]
MSSDVVSEKSQSWAVEPPQPRECTQRCIGFVSLASESATFAANASYLYNATSCPGYTLQELKQTNTGLTAQLDLAGEACNAFESDTQKLTIQVTYETQQRYVVSHLIEFTQQYTIPSSVIPVPDPPMTSYTNSSNLVFNYDASPFAFWITRRFDHPGAMPLSDTTRVVSSQGAHRSCKRNGQLDRTG